MYQQTCSLCACRAAAFILLFVLVSQCPYSPYGAPVIRHPHSPQGQSAMNVIEKQVERSSGVNTTNIIPFEEIFRHSDARELRRAPGPTTQAVAHAALNEVAQQKKASSIPRRQQQPGRPGGRQSRTVSRDAGPQPASTTASSSSSKSSDQRS